MWAWHDGPDGWGWGALWMVLMMAFVWVPIILIILWGFRGFSGAASTTNTHQPPTEPPPSEAPDAREIARQAYARGDIDRDRFLQIIEDLEATER